MTPSTPAIDRFELFLPPLRLAAPPLCYLLGIPFAQMQQCRHLLQQVQQPPLVTSSVLHHSSALAGTLLPCQLGSMSSADRPAWGRRPPQPFSPSASAPRTCGWTPSPKRPRAL